jgi:hypothetical protein
MGANRTEPATSAPKVTTTSRPAAAIAAAWRVARGDDPRSGGGGVPAMSGSTRLPTPMTRQTNNPCSTSSRPSRSAVPPHPYAAPATSTAPATPWTNASGIRTKPGGGRRAPGARMRVAATATSSASCAVPVAAVTSQRPASAAAAVTICTDARAAMVPSAAGGVFVRRGMAVRRKPLAKASRKPSIWTVACPWHE